MAATLATITDQTVLITARHPGQVVYLDGAVAATSTTPGETLRVHGTGTVELGWGDWDKALDTAGDYRGGWFVGSQGVASITDPLPPLKGGRYKARAYNAEGGYEDSTEVELSAPDDRFYLNYGPSLASVARCRWNPSVQLDAGRNTTFRRYVGDDNPTPKRGRLRPYALLAAFRLRPWEGDTPLAEWERISELGEEEAGEVMVWRDPAGRVVHGEMTDWYADDSRAHLQTMSFTFTRTQGTT